MGNSITNTVTFKQTLKQLRFFALVLPPFLESEEDLSVNEEIHSVCALQIFWEDSKPVYSFFIIINTDILYHVRVFLQPSHSGCLWCVQVWILLLLHQRSILRKYWKRMQSSNSVHSIFSTSYPQRWLRPLFNSFKFLTSIWSKKFSRLNDSLIQGE